MPTSGREKTGYPTQKPLGVLNRVIKVHSRPRDVVLDFFAGSGTTGEAAALNGRGFVLIDHNPEAVQIQRPDSEPSSQSASASPLRRLPRPRCSEEPDGYGTIFNLVISAVTSEIERAARSFESLRTASIAFFSAGYFFASAMASSVACFKAVSEATLYFPNDGC